MNVWYLVIVFFSLSLLENPVTYYIESHTSMPTLNVLIYSFTLLFAATPPPAITQERGQVGGVTKELTKDIIPQHSESEVAYKLWL